MLIGQIASNGLVAYSPWFGRLADVAVFSVDVIARNSGTLTIQMQHKTPEQTDAAATNAGTSFTANTIGISSSGSITGLKPLVRFQFTVGGSASDEWTFFRALEPGWQRN